MVNDSGFYIRSCNVDVVVQGWGFGGRLQRTNVGALIIRIGCCGPLYYIYNE